MQGLDQILGSSGMNVDALAAQFGISPDQARSALSTLMPSVLGGFQNQAAAGDPASVAQAAGTVDQPTTDAGNDILGRIFGSKDVSRQVAGQAAGESGVSQTILKAMLPIVAAMVARHLATIGGGAGGGLGGILASVLGGGAGGQNAGAAGGLGGLGDLFGGSGGRNPLDTILGNLRR